MRKAQVTWEEMRGDFWTLEAPESSDDSVHKPNVPNVCISFAELSFKQPYLYIIVAVSLSYFFK